ncbi:MAG: hypothetical protein ACXACB_02005 [Promethearchaeota archaeon]|jgi:hypothetical protein
MKRLWKLFTILLLASTFAFSGCAGLQPKPQVEQPPGTVFKIEDLTTAGAANKIRAFTEVTGVASGSLQAVDCTLLAENDLALAYDVNSATMYFYWFDDGNTNATDDPWEMRPDNYATCGDGVWIAMSSFGIAGVAQPAVNFRDSDQAQQIIAKLYADAADANDSRLYLQVEIDTALTTLITIDGVNEVITMSRPIESTYYISGEVNVTQVTSGPHAVTAVQARGGYLIVTAVIDVDLPDCSATSLGMNICVEQGDASEIVSVAVGDASDDILYEGTLLGVNNEIDSPGGATDRGAFICMICTEANLWRVKGHEGAWDDGGTVD